MVTQVLGVLAALLSAVLALNKIWKSLELTPRARMGLTVLVVALELVAIGLIALYYSPAGEKHA